MYDGHLDTKKAYAEIQDFIEDYIEGTRSMDIDEIADMVQEYYEDDKIKSTDYDHFMSQLE